MNMTKLWAVTKQFTINHAPEILGGISLIAGISCVATTVSATRKADAHLAEFEEKQAKGEEVDTKVYLTTLIKDYAKPIGFGVISVGTGVYAFKLQNDTIKSTKSLAAQLLAEAAATRKAVNAMHGEGAYENAVREQQVTREQKEITNANGEREVVECVRPITSKHIRSFWWHDSQMYIPGDTQTNKDTIDTVNAVVTKHIQALDGAYMSVYDVMKKFEVKLPIDKGERNALKHLGWNAESWGCGVTKTPMPWEQDTMTGKMIYAILVELPEPNKIM